MTIKTSRIQPKRNLGSRANIPAWLSNPDLPAPCPCGMPLLPNQRYIVGTGETGLDRWFHMECWSAGLMLDDDEDEEFDE